ALGCLAPGGAAPSASLRMISWNLSLDQVSQSDDAPAACGAVLAGGALCVGVVGAAADPPAWLSRRTTELYSWVERCSHLLGPQVSSPGRVGRGRSSPFGSPLRTSPKRCEAARARSSARSRTGSAACAALTPGGFASIITVAAAVRATTAIVERA